MKTTIKRKGALLCTVIDLGRLLTKRLKVEKKKLLKNMHKTLVTR